MGQAVWGADPEFFGPRHAHREARILSRLHQVAPAPGHHLECAAGVGSLSLALARQGRTVVAADSSPRSLVVLAQRAAAAELADRVLPVVADVTRLPFRAEAFASATTAETLEHVAEDSIAALELARVLVGGGWLVGTVPAGPAQWSVWDEWAGHLRRYTRRGMAQLLQNAGLRPEVTVWGWPLLRVYDRVFLMRVNRRRLDHGGAVGDDPTLRAVAGLGRRRLLVVLVQMLFALDRPFDGLPWGVGLLFAAIKPAPADTPL